MRHLYQNRCRCSIKKSFSCDAKGQNQHSLGSVCSCRCTVYRYRQCLERQRTESLCLLQLLYLWTCVDLRRATRVSLPRMHSSISTLCIVVLFLFLHVPLYPVMNSASCLCHTWARLTSICQVTLKRNMTQTWLLKSSARQGHCFAQ